VVIDNYNNGSLGLNKLQYFVKYYQNYISIIFNSISKKATDMQLGDVPALKQMFTLNNAEFSIIMSKLPEKIQKLVKGEK